MTTEGRRCPDCRRPLLVGEVVCGRCRRDQDCGTWRDFAGNEVQVAAVLAAIASIDRGAMPS